MGDETNFGWRPESGGGWTKAACGKDDRPGLTLSVHADPHDKDELWTWLVAEVDAYGDQMDIDLGGAANSEAAMEAADAAAIAYVEEG